MGWDQERHTGCFKGISNYMITDDGFIEFLYQQFSVLAKLAVKTTSAQALRHINLIRNPQGGV